MLRLTGQLKSPLTVQLNIAAGVTTDRLPMLCYALNRMNISNCAGLCFLLKLHE